MHDKKHPRRIQPVADRFWRLVDRSQDCWLWIGSRQTFGYGTFASLHDGKFCSMSAHRFSWQLHHGPIATGLRAERLMVLVCVLSLCVVGAMALVFWL